MKHSVKSMEERYNSFAQWPRRFSEGFLMNLSILGQFSLTEEGNQDECKTKCVYCEKTSIFRGNNADNEESFFEKHLLESQNCPLFNIHKKRNRIIINKVSGDFLCDCKTSINMRILENEDFVFCFICGKINAGDCENIKANEISREQQEKPESENCNCEVERKDLKPDCKNFVAEENEGNFSLDINSIFDIKCSEESDDLHEEETLSYFTHKCCSCHASKINFRKSSSFYCNLLKGKYTQEILEYARAREFRLDIEEDDLNLLAYVIKKANVACLEPATDAIEVGIMKVSKEIDECLKTYEDKIIKNIENIESKRLSKE